MAGLFDESVVPSLSMQTTGGAADEPFSLEALGTLSLPVQQLASGERWLIHCASQGGSFFLWLDDHLVCEGGNMQPKWNPFRLEAVLPFAHSPRQTRFFLRATFVQQPARHPMDGRELHQAAGKRRLEASGRAGFSLSWQRTSTAPVYSWGKNRWEASRGAPAMVPVPRSALSTYVPAAQHARLTMQRELIHGYWGTWNERSVTTHVMLPFGVELRFGLCVLSGLGSGVGRELSQGTISGRELSQGTISGRELSQGTSAGGGTSPCELEGTKAMIDDGRVRLGAHGYRHEYTQLFFTSAGVNVSIETMQKSRWGPLLVHARLVGVQARAPNVAFVVSVGATGSDGGGHQLPGRVIESRDGQGRESITVNTDGLWKRNGKSPKEKMGGLTVRGAAGSKSIKIASLGKMPHLAFALGPGSKGQANEGVGLLASRAARGSRTVREISSSMSEARADVERHLEAFGTHAEVKQLTQAALMWNQLSRSMLPGPQTQCARGWGRPWVAFMWDDVFASMQLALDQRALAYSQLTTLLKGKLSEGFVPNMWMPNWISFDRSGPPLGALALRLLHTRYNDDWLVELLFEDVAAWLDWFWRKRRLQPLGLIALGSDPGAMGSKYNKPSLKMAKLESGMDNSPMYDEASFDNTSTLLMRLYDVGMSSLVVAELRHLSALAEASLAHHDAFPDEHARRARQEQGRQLESRARELGQLIQAHLWNEELGAFTNRHQDEGGRLSTRVSPTSFYPLLAGLATDAQAERMVTEWLLSPRRFCIHVEGVSRAERSTQCHWGLPSITFEDAAFKEQDYWRGLVWSPTSLLVYAGLLQYDHVPVVRRGRKALVAQMRSMVLDMWRRHGHVCENYSPSARALNCTGDRFHQWGALASYLSLLEAGYVRLPQLSQMIPRGVAQPAASASADRAASVAAKAGANAEVKSAPKAEVEATREVKAKTTPSASSASAAPSTSQADRGLWRDWRRHGSGWYAWAPFARDSLPSPWTKAPAPEKVSAHMWRDWHWYGSGWYEWSPFARQNLPTSWTSVPPAPKTASAAPRPASTAERAGYAQALEAEKAERTGVRIESWLNFILRHLMGAIGSEGIEELDLDRLDS